MTDEEIRTLEANEAAILADRIREEDGDDAADRRDEAWGNVDRFRARR